MTRRPSGFTVPVRRGLWELVRLGYAYAEQTRQRYSAGELRDLRKAFEWAHAARFMGRDPATARPLEGNGS